MHVRQKKKFLFFPCYKLVLGLYVKHAYLTLGVFGLGRNII